MSNKEKFEEWKAKNDYFIPTLLANGDMFSDVHSKLSAIQELILCAKYLNGDENLEGKKLFSIYLTVFPSHSHIVIMDWHGVNIAGFKDMATAEIAREILPDDLIKTALT